MSREKGTPKTGGRKAGTPNKVTQSLKERIVDILSDNIDKFQKDIDSLSAKDRVSTCLGLMQFVLPKQQSVRADVGVDMPCRDLVIKYVGEKGDEVFPSSESEVDMEKGYYLRKK